MGTYCVHIACSLTLVESWVCACVCVLNRAKGRGNPYNTPGFFFGLRAALDLHVDVAVTVGFVNHRCHEKTLECVDETRRCLGTCMYMYMYMYMWVYVHVGDARLNTRILHRGKLYEFYAHPKREWLPPS